MKTEHVAMWLHRDIDSSAWIVAATVESGTKKWFPPTADGRAAAISYGQQLADRLGVEMIEIGDC